MLETVLRVLSLCLALAGVEMLHGIARTLYLVPAVGRERAQRIGIVSGLLLAFAVCYVMVPLLGFTLADHPIGLGVALSLFMAIFDVGVARWVAKRPWAAVRRDFNPMSGNYLIFGLVALPFFPYAALVLRGSG